MLQSTTSANVGLVPFLCFFFPSLSSQQGFFHPSVSPPAVKQRQVQGTEGQRDLPKPVADSSKALPSLQWKREQKQA